MIICTVMTQFYMYSVLHVHVYSSEFFENLAEEAKVDPDKPVVIKNAIHARKTIARRSKAKKYFERRKSSSKYTVFIFCCCTICN